VGARRRGVKKKFMRTTARRPFVAARPMKILVEMPAANVLFGSFLT
jgi:hypothetical protein